MFVNKGLRVYEQAISELEHNVFSPINPVLGLTFCMRHCGILVACAVQIPFKDGIGSDHWIVAANL